MAFAMKGLRLKPTYEQLIDVAVSDGLDNIRFPNRDASFFTKWVCFKSIGWRRYETNGKTTRNGKYRIL